jgi:O-antigen/teichoic acid export membrane protein
MKLSHHWRVALSAWGSRLLVALAQLMAVRILLSSLSTESYSVWAVMISLTGWFLLADLGIAQVTQNRLARMLATGAAVHGAVRQSVRTVALIGIALGVLCTLSAPWTGDLLLGRLLADPAARRWCVSAGAWMLIAASWSAVAAKIWYALGHGVRANLLPMLAFLCSLAAVYFLPPMFAPELRLKVALAAWLAPAALVGALSLALIWLQAHGGAGEEPARMTVLRQSLPFWSYAAMGIVTLNVDYAILARSADPTELVAYNLVTKVFAFLFFFYASTLAVFSPRFSRAHATGRLDQAFGMLRRHMLISSAAFLAVATGMWFALPAIFVHVFKVSHIQIPASLFFAVVALNFVRVWADGYATFLVAIDQVRTLSRFLPAQAVLSVGFQVILAHRYGALGIILGLILSYLLTVSWGFPVMTRALLLRPAPETDIRTPS